jgi:hypothetical protein
MALFNEFSRQGRSHKAGPTGHKNFHAYCLLEKSGPRVKIDYCC